MANAIYFQLFEVPNAGRTYSTATNVGWSQTPPALARSANVAAHFQNHRDDVRDS
jgi:hypothetical protein